MTMNYDEALETALGLSADIAALETFLETIPTWRAQLERELRLADTIGRDLSAIAPAPAAVLRRQRDLMEIVGRLGSEEPPVVWSRLAGLLAAFARPRFLASATAAAAMLALAFVVALPALDSSGPATAEAVVLEGSVAEIGSGQVTINTATSAELVKLSSDTVLTDGFGNTVQPSSLNAGQTVVLRGSRSDEGVIASQLELKDRLFGTVLALSSDSLRLRTTQSEHTIAITADTEFEGRVGVGTYVEVKVLRLSDGSLRALEIENEAEESADGDQDGESQSPPSSSSPSPGASPSAGGSTGGEPEDEEHEDTPKAEEEHADEPEPEEEHSEDSEDHESSEQEDD